MPSSFVVSLVLVGALFAEHGVALEQMRAPLPVTPEIQTLKLFRSPRSIALQTVCPLLFLSLWYADFVPSAVRGAMPDLALAQPVCLAVLLHGVSAVVAAKGSL